MWEPGQETAHLGLTVDTKLGYFSLTDVRQIKLKRLATGLRMAAAREHRWVKVKDVAALTTCLGQSAYLAIPPARFYLRELHDMVVARSSWDGRVKLSRQALRDKQLEREEQGS